jgi:hypothetical protein
MNAELLTRPRHGRTPDTTEPKSDKASSAPAGTYEPHCLQRWAESVAGMDETILGVAA